MPFQGHQEGFTALSRSSGRFDCSSSLTSILLQNCTIFSLSARRCFKIHAIFSFFFQCFTSTVAVLVRAIATLKVATRLRFVSHSGLIARCSIDRSAVEAFVFQNATKVKKENIKKTNKTKKQQKKTTTNKQTNKHPNCRPR